MTNLSPAAQSAQNAARQANGRFGNHLHADNDAVTLRGEITGFDDAFRAAGYDPADVDIEQLSSPRQVEVTPETAATFIGAHQFSGEEGIEVTRYSSGDSYATADVTDPHRDYYHELLGLPGHYDGLEEEDQILVQQYAIVAADYLAERFDRDEDNGSLKARVNVFAEEVDFTWQRTYVDQNVCMDRVRQGRDDAERAVAKMFTSDHRRAERDAYLDDYLPLSEGEVDILGLHHGVRLTPEHLIGRTTRSHMESDGIVADAPTFTELRARLHKSL